MPDDQESKPKTQDELLAIRMANIEKYQYKPGETGNPNGRPKGKTVASEIKRIIAERGEKNQDVVRGLALVAIEQALKGDYRYFEAVRELVDGPRPKGGVSISGNMIQVVFEDLKPPEGYDPPRMPADVADVQ